MPESSVTVRTRHSRTVNKRYFMICSSNNAMGFKQLSIISIQRNRQLCKRKNKKEPFTINSVSSAPFISTASCLGVVFFAILGQQTHKILATQGGKCNAPFINPCATRIFGHKKADTVTDTIVSITVSVMGIMCNFDRINRMHPGVQMGESMYFLPRQFESFVYR